MNTTTTLAWANIGCQTPGILESWLTSDNADAEADKDLRTLLIRRMNYAGSSMKEFYPLCGIRLFVRLQVEIEKEYHKNPAIRHLDLSTAKSSFTSGTF